MEVVSTELNGTRVFVSLVCHNPCIQVPKDEILSIHNISQTPGRNVTHSQGETPASIGVAKFTTKLSSS